MAFDFENTQRTVWEVADRIAFFKKMRAMLNIDDQDAQEIVEQLLDRNFDYLEIAAYLPGTKGEEPDAALVFDGKRDVYWDVFNVDKSNTLIATIRSLAGNESKLTYTRGLTLRDWRKRLEAISEM